MTSLEGPELSRRQVAIKMHRRAVRIKRMGVGFTQSIVARNRVAFPAPGYVVERHSPTEFALRMERGRVASSTRKRRDT
eukprot:8785474-Pyramimonas_sp.AAC.1